MFTCFIPNTNGISINGTQYVYFLLIFHSVCVSLFIRNPWRWWWWRWFIKLYKRSDSVCLCACSAVCSWYIKCMRFKCERDTNAENQSHTKPVVERKIEEKNWRVCFSAIASAEADGQVTYMKPRAEEKRNTTRVVLKRGMQQPKKKHFLWKIRYTHRKKMIDTIVRKHATVCVWACVFLILEWCKWCIFWMILMMVGRWAKKTDQNRHIYPATYIVVSVLNNSQNGKNAFEFERFFSFLVWICGCFPMKQCMHACNGKISHIAFSSKLRNLSATAFKNYSTETEKKETWIVHTIDKANK